MYRFRSIIEHAGEDIPPRVKEIIALESKNLFDGNQSVSDWNDIFISTHKSRAAHVQAGLRVRHLLHKGSHEQDEKDLIEALSLQGLTLVEATTGLELLEEWRSSEEVVEAYKKAAESIWSEATVFKTS
jgi:peptide alpha-N-acetyltransferase